MTLYFDNGLTMENLCASGAYGGAIQKNSIGQHETTNSHDILKSSEPAKKYNEQMAI